MKKINLIGLFAVSSLFFVSCGGGDKKEGDKPNVDTTLSAVDTGMIEEELTLVLPSPVQVAEIFANSGVTFSKDLPNSTENAKKYATSTAKSLNFGVYISDMAFCIVSEKNNEAGEYLKAVRTLGNEIGLNEIFDDESLLTRFDKNMSNQDSLTDLMIEIRDRIDMYYEENGERAMSSVYFAGGWIEGMYLCAITAGKGNAKAGKALAAQLYMLDDILKGLGKVQEKTNEYDKLIKDLEDLKATFASFETVKGAGEDQMYDVALSAEETKLLAEKLISIRNDIVKA